MESGRNHRTPSISWVHKGSRVNGSPNCFQSAKVPAPPAKDATTTVPPKSKTVGLDQQILDLYDGHQGIAVAAESVAIALDIDVKVVNLAFGRLAAKGKVKKTDDGYMLTAGSNIQDMPTAKAS